MHKTQNSLPEQIRADIVTLLNARLADSIDLMHQAKQAPWNVKGMSSIALHKLLDDIVDAAEEYSGSPADFLVLRAQQEN